MAQGDNHATPVNAVSGRGGAGTNSLAPDEIETFKRQLLELREKATGNMTFLRSDSLKPVRPGDEDEDSFDHDFALSVAGSEENAIGEIDDALGRIEAGTYGICEMTGEPIGKARLQAIPYARYCVAAQSQQEGGCRRPLP